MNATGKLPALSLVIKSSVRPRSETNSQPNLPENEFHLSGDDWEIRFKWVKLKRYPYINGFFYLFRILQHKGPPLTPIAIIGAKNQELGMANSRSAAPSFKLERGRNPEENISLDAGPLIDEKAKKEYKNHLLQIKEERERAIANDDRASLDRLDKEVSDIKKGTQSCIWA